MDLWIMKMIALAVILGLTILFGLIPIRLVAWIHRRERNEQPENGSWTSGTRSQAMRILGYLNCISGGVFLAICFMHLFPEVIEKYNSIIAKTKSITDFPIPELIVSVGFFVIMLTEHGAMSWNKRSQEHTADDRVSLIRNGSFPSYQNNESSVQPETSAGRSATSDHLPGGRHAAENASHYLQSLSNSYDRSYTCAEGAPHHHHPGQSHSETVQIHGIRSIILLLALSIHTIFEGLALGLETSMDSILMMLLALSIHKAIIAFTLGLQLTDTFQQTSRVLSYMVIFSIMSPIGISIGTAVTAVNKGSSGLNISSMILQGLATGTFLYVTFFEILQKELGVSDHSISKVLAIMFGFAIIASTKLVGV